MQSLDEQYYRDEHLLVDLRGRVVVLDGQILTLTRTEYRLMALLVEHAGEIVPRPILLMLTPTVDAHLWRLWSGWAVHVVAARDGKRPRRLHRPT